MSSFGSSTGQINRQATSGSHRPDAKDGTLRDVPQADKARAAGGPGQSLVSRLRRWTHAVDAAPASDLMDEAADEIERLRLELSRYAKCDNAPQPNATPGEGSEHGGCALTDAERGAIAYYVGTGGPDAVDATLRGLIDRTKTVGM